MTGSKKNKHMTLDDRILLIASSLTSTLLHETIQRKERF